MGEREAGIPALSSVTDPADRRKDPSAILFRLGYPFNSSYLPVEPLELVSGETAPVEAVVLLRLGTEMTKRRSLLGL